MINSLYDKFKSWSSTGSIWIISDTHFEDSDCKLMDKNWISPQEHINIIKNKCHKTDTLIHLGDVGNPEWLNQIKSYKVLIMGNHDESASRFKDYFDEIYKGPLFISEKILLSHEPIIEPRLWLNIHGHNHSGYMLKTGELNLASNVANYEPLNLKKIIELGILKQIDGVHRATIDDASKRKKEK